MLGHQQMIQRAVDALEVQTGIPPVLIIGQRLDVLPEQALGGPHVVAREALEVVRPRRHRWLSPHIRKTPNFASGIGAFRLADSASASTRRVSAGSMTPSSHSRALA